MRDLLPITIILSIAATSHAALYADCKCSPDPAPGLASFTYSAVSTDSKKINAFAGIRVQGLVHNIWTLALQQTIHSGDRDDVPPVLGDPDWRKFDTHLVFDLTNNPSQILGVIGSLPTETNDGGNPTGLNLSQGGYQATIGLGTFSGGTTNRDLIALTPAAAATRIPFLQVVVPRSSLFEDYPRQSKLPCIPVKTATRSRLFVS